MSSDLRHTKEIEFDILFKLLNKKHEKGCKQSKVLLDSVSKFKGTVDVSTSEIESIDGSSIDQKIDEMLEFLSNT